MATPTRSAVAAALCTDYGRETVDLALESVLAPLGGMAAFVRPGERVALKPNCLLAAEPERAITTHPSLVRAVALAVREAGGIPIIVESPGAGNPHTAAALRRVFRKTGLTDMAEEIGLDIDLRTEVEPVSAPEAVLVKRVEVLRGLREVDAVISLPKLKTHTYMTYTGAVKNLFGAIPGFAKPGYHAKLADPDRFAEMLLDVCGLIAPRLSIMDGVLALEGDGPGTGGRPRHLGVLLAGEDPVALDIVACRVAGIEPEAVPVLRAAQGRGLVRLEDDPRIAGTDLPRPLVPDYAWPEHTWNGGGIGPRAAMERLLRPVLNNATNPRPRPREGRCTACRTCEHACPTAAISVGSRLAVVDDARCIRCYCCHELCPENAIDLELAPLGRLARVFGVR